MAKRVSYHQQVVIDKTLQLTEVLDTLPPFVKEYFRGIDSTTSIRTKLSYAYDIRVFFEFLLKEKPSLKGKTMKELEVDILDDVTAVDLEEYIVYLKLYDNGDRMETNAERGQKRKLSALRSFYAYYYKRERISSNPSVLVDMPRIHEKSIIRLDPDEVAILLDYVEQAGETLTGQQKVYYEKTRERDLAIITLLLGTGIRVSECVGLDIEDLDFRSNGILVTRKGGKQMTVYFGEEVEEALRRYLKVRAGIVPLEGHEHALFYSTRRKRIGIQAVENLVKKYARHVTTTKKITPHKLRSTYGTSLYQETGDIYLVAEVLGHSDVNTTRAHYAAMDDARRRKAASAVRLREKSEASLESNLQESNT